MGYSQADIKLSSLPLTFVRVTPPDIDLRSSIINIAIPPKTLGIEITDARLAACCGLGNIDPQHGFARGHDIPGRAAIEVALAWPLPPFGATLATIRPDADSIGAMALLSLRADRVALTPELCARVDLISRSDCFDFGDWASWAAAHPPPCPDEPLLALALHPPEIRALAASIGLNGDDLGASVAMMRDWLLTGALPPEGEAEVLASDQRSANEWVAGLLRVTPLLGGKIAHVASDVRGAVALGYRTAPIVIAEGHIAGKRKITIAQFERGHIDLAELAMRINVEEPGWGGSATILGSPQGRATAVDITKIVQNIEAIDIAA